MTTTLTHTQLSDQITAMYEDATYLDRLDQRAGADLLRSHAELLESTLNLIGVVQR